MMKYKDLTVFETLTFDLWLPAVEDEVRGLVSLHLGLGLTDCDVLL